MRQSLDSTYTGVRAEPKFLRDPTSLEFISSNLTRFSSYVVSNLPKRRMSMSYTDIQPPFRQYQAQPNTAAVIPPPISQHPVDDISKAIEDDNLDKVTFTAFQTVESLGLDGSLTPQKLCLLLGYHDGFQIWDISNPDNIHEICSIRDKETLGTVTYLHIIANSRSQAEGEDQEEDHDSLLAIVSRHGSADIDPISNTDHGHERSASTSSGRSSNHATTTLRLYSLSSHTIVKEFENFDEDEDSKVTSIKSNHNAIVVGCTSSSSSSLHVLSHRSLTPLSAPLMDVFHDPVNGPVFALGARFLAYATNTPVLNDDLGMGEHKSISSTGLGVLQGDKDVKDIAKEVVSGVKSLSEFGYQTLSNYFGNNQPDKIPSVSAPTPRAISPGSARYDYQRSTSSVPPAVSAAADSTGGAVGHQNKKQPASGMVIIRDIAKLPNTPTRNMSISTVVHFRPHTHPLSCLSFNAAGTLLLSASKQGHTFHIFSIVPSSTVPGNVSHLYSLTRGYTDAQVEDCQFSTDSMWCSVSTARGTTHVYAINPYGGKPEISGHVAGKVNNPPIRPFMKQRFRIEKCTSLNSVVRVKQRRAMITDLSQNEPHNQPTNTNYYPPRPTQGTKQPQLQLQHKPCGRLASIFLLPTKTPYLPNVVTKAAQGAGGNGGKTLLETSMPFKTFKEQASSMLSSLGTSIGNAGSEHGTSRHNSWTSARDKLADNRLFGFDEEEAPTVDDDVKTLHDDNIGYQDMYSIHPLGVLTLHRCWISRSVVKKRDQTRSIELVVKQEDIAEWSMARTTEWEVVKVPLSNDLTVSDIGSSSVATATAARKKKRRPWLSNAEIMTYLSDEPPLWTSSLFTLQTFTEDPSTLSHKMWVTGEIPAAQPVTVRRELPEPYSTRIDRVNKTMAHITNQDEENLDDALAELEDNISKAMQTTFASLSPTNLISGSYGTGVSPGGYKRTLQPPLAPSWTPSTISFEDAHLISMGSGPSPEDLLTHDPRYHHQHAPHQQRSTAMTAPNSLGQLHNSSLIYFGDVDEYEAEHGGGLEPASVSSIRFDDEVGEHNANNDGHGTDQVFSPDGDNEMAYPSESILAEKPQSV